MASSQDGRWATFAGGLLIGSALAAGGAYLAVRYALLERDSRDEIKVSARKRTSKPPSPIARHLLSGNRRALPSSSLDEFGTAARTDTEVYYETPPKEQQANGAAPQERSGRPPTLPIPSPPQVNLLRRLATNRAASSSALNQLTMAHGNGSGDPALTLEPLQQRLVRQETFSESDAAVVASRGGLSVIYAGPADRANPSVLEALRHTAFVPGTGPHSVGATPPSGNGHPLYHAAPSPSPSSTAKYGESPAGATPGAGPGSRAHSNHGHAAGMAPPPAGSAAGAAQQLMAAAAQSNNTVSDVLATEGRIIEDAALHEQYSRVILPEPTPNEETDEVCWLLQRALDSRQRWLFRPETGPEATAHLPEVTRMNECLSGDPFAWKAEEALPFTCAMESGVMQIFGPDGATLPLVPPGTAHEYFSDMHWLLKISALGHVRSFTHSRLQLLEQKFNLHVMLNADKEFLAQKSAPHRDFYNVRKVDTHVHHSACMHQKHLLRFIKSKLKKEGDEVVIFRDGKYLTLKEVFESLNLTPYDLSVDTLDVHADKNIFHRFDKFNLKYNPFGQSRLREVFIKQDNLIHGRYLAELTREVFNDLEMSKYQHTEYRISVYGRKPVEWDTLAAWVVQNRLYSDNNMWMIQVPRLYNVYKEQGIIENFQQLLDNLFDPLFEATIDPGTHPMLHVFLRHVSGFDLVDDESKPERRPNKHMPPPAEWTSKHNPAYAYYTYYVYANLYVLNRLREARGLNTFSLRPHAGEAGDLDHLVSTFLLAQNIAHGINLRKSPCLQYLYYAAQVGLCMSPLSNNSLFLDYHKNPFPQFFARGLSVSLSTDDPLQIHLTREPLVEEYSVAAQVWKLSGTDLCEVARNSVLHSGFPDRLKQHWVHTEFWRGGPEGNSIQKTNVPALRMIFRKDCHGEEVGLLAAGSVSHAARTRAKELARAAQDA